jgi:hypothetical protein
MSLEQKVTDEMKTAMKAGNKDRLNALRSIRASILEFQKSGIGRELNEQDEFKLINSLAKRRKDAIEIYEQNGKQEMAETEKIELAVISEFLPAMMSESEITEFVKAKINETGAEGPAGLGKVMGPSMKELSGKADGSLVQKIVKELLGINS